MATDMSLGGGAGFGAGYTPIRFAPLMSLTGPVMAPATPAAPEAAAPMAPALRLPQMSDMPDNAYMTGEIPTYGGPSIGNRSGAEIRGDLGRIGEFFMSPLSTMASYAMTGKMPSEQMQGLLGGAGGNPLSEFLQGLQGSFARNVFGPEEVPLFETRAPMQTAVPSMVFDGGLYSVTPELSPIEQTNALFNDPAFYNAIAAGVPMGQMQQTNMAPGILGGGPGANQLLSDIYGVMQFAPGGMQSGPGGASLSEEGGYGYGGGTVGETGAPGESSYGLDR